MTEFLKRLFLESQTGPKQHHV